MPRRLVLTVLLLCSGAASAREDEADRAYVNYKAVRVSIRTGLDLARMDKIADTMLSCHERVGGTTDYAVAPERMADLDASGLVYVVLNDNIRATIDAERGAIETDRGTSWFTAYKTYAEIDAKLTALVAENPAIASRFVLGTKTVENRDIYGIRITGPSTGAPKPQLMIEGTQHAREWAAAMTPMYVADQLIQQYGADPLITDIVNRAEIHIVPVANPDGYVYSWTNASTRLWRKNRRNNGNGSFGVDNNRNWGYQWGGVGSSGISSSDVYRGPSAFSEPETRAVRDYIAGLANLRAHMDWHTYSQLVMWPWGYTDTASTPDEAQFDRFGQAMRTAILSATGVPYTAGAVGPTLYIADGNINDWVYGVRNVMTYIIEMRDTGATGFQLPAAQIIPNATENFAAWKVLATQAVNPIDFTAVSSPTAAPRLAPISLSATLTPTLKTAVNPASPKVYYRVGNSGAYTPIAMTAGAGGVYTATIPGQFCGAVVSYYYEAATALGDTQDYPNLALASPFSLTVSNPPSCVAVPGDVTQDGEVTFADLNAILSGFGAPYTFADLNTVLSNFGATG